MRSVDLTPTEIKVTKILCEGLSNKEIAVALGFSEKTIKNNLSHIFMKTGCQSRCALVSYAYRTGLMKLPLSEPERPAHSDDTAISRAKALGYRYCG